MINCHHLFFYYSSDATEHIRTRHSCLSCRYKDFPPFHRNPPLLAQACPTSPSTQKSRTNNITVLSLQNFCKVFAMVRGLVYEDLEFIYIRMNFLKLIFDGRFEVDFYHYTGNKLRRWTYPRLGNRVGLYVHYSKAVDFFLVLFPSPQIRNCTEVHRFLLRIHKELFLK